MRLWRRSAPTVALLAAACASTAPDVAPGGAATLPWQIPAGEEGRQSLFHIQIASERGGGSLRAVLRLATAFRYEIAASDGLGRQLWTLSVAPGLALWQDHRSRRACLLGDEIQIPDLGVPALRLSALPALLLGRLPAVAFATARPPLGASGVYELVEGTERWSWRAAGEDIQSWTLYQSDIPVLWWRQDGASRASGVLSARGKGAQVRWRRVLSEALPAALAEPRAETGYAMGKCDELALP